MQAITQKTPFQWQTVNDYTSIYHVLIWYLHDTPKKTKLKVRRDQIVYLKIKILILNLARAGYILNLPTAPHSSPWMLAWISMVSPYRLGLLRIQFYVNWYTPGRLTLKQPNKLKFQLILRIKLKVKMTSYMWNLDKPSIIYTGRIVLPPISCACPWVQTIRDKTKGNTCLIR